jgi:hypothetical protein
MTAPTEAEIREQLRIGAMTHTHHKENLLGPRLMDTVHWTANPLTWPATVALDFTPRDFRDFGDDAENDGAALYGRLSPAEARRLRQLTHEAEQRAAERCEAIILDELTAAGARFASEFPDAARPRVPVR